LERDGLARLLAALRDRLEVAAAAEITLEANPEDATPDSLAAWAALGVSRISLGVQSFDDEALGALGRAHTAEQATFAVERALAAGFDAVSLDLIFAVPGQTSASWESTLLHAVELRPHHISCYELTVHEGTRFFRARERGAFAEASADAKAEQFFAAHHLLEDAGYSAYEVSNFARGSAYRSRHNSKYWNHTPYLGLGPSAHSFDGRARRWWNPRSLSDWMPAVHGRGSDPGGEEGLTRGQLVLEALALGLRTSEGVDLQTLESRWGIDVMSNNLQLIDDLVARGFLQAGRGSRLVPTLAGLAVADGVAASFEVRAQGDRGGESEAEDRAAGESAADADIARGRLPKRSRT
jgi:oxygen-independent coproporphyrinogen-3 oxidase